MYFALPYALAQVLIEVPYIFVQMVVYVVIVYASIDFRWTAAKFFALSSGFTNLDGFLQLHSSTSADSCVVEMVLLGFSLSMDSLWTDSISVREYFR
jgi:hypothetical protein